ncbi:ABC transporter substrate-binding protein [Actinoplanes derwentensis]|uniref:Carbohydrate ABC transporter substrate-binding protein, CUT1 family n=1 Tax=Actinoplanes derwentensis TaxID=113562 RepID=A0A1H2B887_9ACTN|nr:ABC transporter substrate-binding protein [Actinoplanes derwentensis]SDT54485.1 carbohydrate ABC transporter substrate-binding protein, CUT1 family [Actinoplanes derwentensis]
MVNRRQLLMLGALGAAAPALTACGGGDDVDGTGAATLNFAFWGNDDRAGKYKQAIDLFQQQNTTIKVQTSFAAWDVYWQQRSTEAASSSLPDVLQMDLAYLAKYSRTRQLLKLDDNLGSGLNVSGIDPNILPAGKYEDGTFAIPTGTNAFTLNYNATLLAELGVAEPKAPLTWAQYQQFIKDVSAKGAARPEKVYGSWDYTSVFWTFLHFVRQSGKDPFNGNKINFTEADLTAWWSSTAPMRPTELLPAKVVTELKPVSPFAKSRTASEFSWDNQIAGYLGDAGGKGEFKQLTLPTDSGTSGLFYKASMLLAVAQNSKFPKQSVKLIDFLINNPEVGKIFGTSKGVPVVQAQRDAIQATGIDANVLAYEASVKSSVGTSQGALPEGFGTIETDFLTISEEISYGKVTPADAAKRWFANAADALEQ